ncbi:MAG TPA: hypothetical protein VLM76_00885 [Patescibacteria group bacterium]|nr:hypothetical protein [Patescibacteria group bacterium]
MSTPTTPTTTLTCEAGVGSVYATRPQLCGKPANAAFRIRGWREERVEARCAAHAGAIKRSGSKDDLLPLTAEVAEAIATRQAEAKARREAERVAERERAAIATEAARVAAHADDAVAWSAVRDDDERLLDGWVGGQPTYCAIPRWAVRREDGEGPWDDIGVKVETKDGWPAAIELRAGSRLTRRQALALAEALRAAAEHTA